MFKCHYDFLFMYFNWNTIPQFCTRNVEGSPTFCFTVIAKTEKRKQEKRKPYLACQFFLVCNAEFLTRN